MSVVYSRPRIGVGIVNWNSGIQLSECIKSLIRSSSSVDVDIVVVDNASHDSSMDFVKEIFGIQTVFSDVNLGFGRACNIAAQKLSNEFILFLNPDACVYPDTLERVLEFMDGPHAVDIGICGVQLFDEKNKISKSCARFPSASNLFFQATGLAKLQCFYQKGPRMAEWDHENSQIVDQLIGAFFFVRRKVFDELVGFDERFFVYFEEVDFSLRAKQIGWNSYYLSTAHAFHSGGGTSNQVKAKRLFYSLRSRLLYVCKNLSLPAVIWVLFSTLCLEPISRISFAFLKGSTSSVGETVRGYLMLFNWMVKKSFDSIKK